MTLSSDEIPANNSKLYPYPSNLNHIAVSVTNIEEVIEWYTKVLGFNVVKPLFEAVADDTHIGKIFQDVFGKNFKKLKIAHLSFGNQIGFEVFEFVEPIKNRIQKYLTMNISKE